LKTRINLTITTPPFKGQEQMITIWGRMNSSNVQKVIWTADEAGVPYQRIDAGMAFGINSTPEYRAMNPNGLIPVMKDGDFVLWESNAISRYLADTYAPGRLNPTAIKARAVVDQWMDWTVTEFNPAINMAFHHLVRFKPEDRDPAIIEASRSKTEQKLALLEQRLQVSAHVAGEDFTIADVIAGVFVNRWRKLPLTRVTNPAIDAWFETISARPAAKQVLSVPLT
jgi:glutathione S-transferase